MRESYVIYQSTKAAEDMFTAMELFPDSAETDWGKFISNEKAKVNLDVALILLAIEKGPYQHAQTHPHVSNKPSTDLSTI